MAHPFPGFPPESLKFLRALKRHNDREWFQPRKAQFDQVLREPMLGMLEQINEQLKKFAPDYITDPAKAIFRIYRDTRFSKDKTPYKTHLAAVFSHRKMPRNHGAGFYLQLSAEELGIGGGIYQPPPDTLRLLRPHWAENHAEFERVITKVKGRKMAGQLETHSMTRPPKGWGPEHPAAELLKSRSLFFYAGLPAETALAPSAVNEVASRFRAIAEVVHLLDVPFVGQRKFSLKEFA